MNSDWSARYKLAVSAALEAGHIARAYYPESAAAYKSQVEWKADQSPVSVADRDAEVHLRKVLLDAFPDDGFLGEEGGDTAGTSGYRWIVDPVDGTRSFVRSIPLWGTLVALTYHGEPILGIAHEPCLGNTYRALKGDGAYRNDKPIHVSDVDSLAESVLFYSNLTYFKRANVQEQFLELVHKTQRSRGYGDYFGFVLVAQGSGDLMVEHGVHVWDIAGLKVIVEEAGGRFTTWDGGGDIERPDVIASNGRVHDAALAILGAKA